MKPLYGREEPAHTLPKTCPSFLTPAAAKRGPGEPVASPLSRRLDVPHFATRAFPTEERLLETDPM